MTREEAIKMLKSKMDGHTDTSYEWVETVRMAIKALEQEPKWIPVSERLPEINQRVLVTSYGRVCYAMMISEDDNSGYPVFRLQDSLNERVVCETTVHSKFTTGRITAWMPLPKPYKEESESKRYMELAKSYVQGLRTGLAESEERNENNN